MICTTTKKDLLQVVQKAYPIVPAKSTLQILSNFKIASDGNTLSVTATDLDHSIMTAGSVTGGESFETAVNARKVFEIIKELPDGELSIGVEDGLFVIKSEKGFSCKIAGADCSDFPSFPQVDGGEEFDISIEMLSRMIGRSSFAASRDESRACLCGILWEIGQKRNSMIATDGHRLGRSIVHGEFGATGDSSAIVAPKTLLHIVRIADGETEKSDIHVKVGEKYIVFAAAGVNLCSKLIDGPYPDYSKAIPSNNPKKVVVERKILQEALRRVCVLSNQKTNLVKFVFTSGQLELSVMNRDIAGEAREVVPATYDEEEHIIGFNGQYLSEILGIIGTEKIRMEMNTEISACLVFPEEGDKPQGEDLFLIMPLRILEEG